MPIAHNYACCTTCGNLMHRPSFQGPSAPSAPRRKAGSRRKSDQSLTPQASQIAYCAYCQTPSCQVPAGVVIATTVSHGREYDVCRSGVTPTREVTTNLGLFVEIDSLWYRAASKPVGLEAAWRFARRGHVFMRAGRYWREVYMDRPVTPPQGVERTLETART